MTEIRRAYVGIGSNLGDRIGYVRMGISALTRLRECRLISCSSLYRSTPVGIVDQPDFINAVCRIDTSLPPQALLHELFAIERAHGRRRGPIRGGARTLDLDILLYGDLQMTSAELTLPHPRLHERAFVLCPLSEIAPTLRIPGRESMAHLLAACRTQAITRISDSVFGKTAAR